MSNSGVPSVLLNRVAMPISLFVATYDELYEKELLPFKQEAQEVCSSRLLLFSNQMSFTCSEIASLSLGARTDKKILKFHATAYTRRAQGISRALLRDRLREVAKSRDLINR